VNLRRRAFRIRALLPLAGHPCSIAGDQCTVLGEQFSIPALGESVVTEGRVPHDSLAERVRSWLAADEVAAASAYQHAFVAAGGGLRDLP
jgi:hypothetical protein